MAKTTPIKLGILGLGRAGWAMHCKELKGREKKFRIVAACDILPDRCERMAQTYGCRTYDNIDAFLADPEMELVSVATRSLDHFDHAARALKAGKDVFLEKPITVTYEEARKLKTLAARAKANLYIRHNRRFEPGFHHVREIIDSGVLGDVFEIKLRRASYQRRDDWQTIKRFGGGQLLNWGPHIIDHALRLLDAPVKTLWSDLKRIAAVGDAEDHLKIIFVGRNGRLIDLEISGAAAIGEPVYLVWGSRGALSGTDNEIKLRYLDPRKKLVERKANPGTPGEGFGSQDDLKWIEKTIPVKPKSKANTDQIWDALHDTIRNGKPFPITLEQAVEVMKIVEEVKKGTRFAQRRAAKPRGRTRKTT